MGGSKAHCYGMVPAHFLSSYVLGVRRDLPVWEKRLVIDPRLGDLTSADGRVCTEFGPVDVSWKREGDALNFSFDLPAGVTADPRLPGVGMLDGNAFDGHADPRRDGRHTGHVSVPRANWGPPPSMTGDRADRVPARPLAAADLVQGHRAKAGFSRRWVKRVGGFS